jgi:hypothetical protein
MGFHPLIGKRSWRVSRKSRDAVSLFFLPKVRPGSYHSLILLDIDLVAKHDLLTDQEFISRKGEICLTNGKLSGSLGEAWIRNSSLQLSSVSKLLELLTS